MSSTRFWILNELFCFFCSGGWRRLFFWFLSYHEHSTMVLGHQNIRFLSGITAWPDVRCLLWCSLRLDTWRGASWRWWGSVGSWRGGHWKVGWKLKMVKHEKKADDYVWVLFLVASLILFPKICNFRKLIAEYNLQSELRNTGHSHDVSIRYTSHQNHVTHQEQPGLHGLDHELEKLGGLISSQLGPEWMQRFWLLPSLHIMVAAQTVWMMMQGHVAWG